MLIPLQPGPPHAGILLFETQMRKLHDINEKPYQPPPSEYQGTELRQNAGMLPGRMHAYSLPSRVGGRLHYPDGRVERFPGTEVPQ